MLPNFFSRAALRRSPIFGNSSSKLSEMRRNRSAALYVLASRCDSSRTRCNSFNAPLSWDRRNGSFSPGRYISSNSLAKPIMGIWPRPSFSNSAQAAPSWPLPPSIRIRSGKTSVDRFRIGPGARPARRSAAAASDEMPFRLLPRAAALTSSTIRCNSWAMGWPPSAWSSAFSGRASLSPGFTPDGGWPGDKLLAAFVSLSTRV